MNKEQVLQAVAMYRTILQAGGDEAQEVDFDLVGPTRGEAVRHILAMCTRVETMIAEDQMEKAMRWLGFMQGSFWLLGLFSLNDMREHNIRPVA